MAKPKGWKADLWRQIKRDERKAIREGIAALRRAIRDAREARAVALVQARATCKREKLAARERARQLRARLLEELRQRVRAERQTAHDKCREQFAAVAALTDLVARDRAQLRAELAFRKEMRRIEAAQKAERIRIAGRGARAHERLRESDDEVEGNIPPELRALWDKVKGRIRGDRRRTRTEAFLEYAEAHAAEVLVATGDAADARLEELIAERAERDRELADKDAELEAGPPSDDVPF